MAAPPERLFKTGERVRLTEVPFAGIEGIYQMADGERRVMVLIEILSKPVAACVAPASLRKASYQVCFALPVWQKPFSKS